MSMRHRGSALLLATLLLAAGLPDAPRAAATDPSPVPGSQQVTIPPLLANGPITLPNGRVLPAMPRGLQQSSIQAEMLALHEADRVDFTPGERPRPRGAAGADLALGLTQPSGSATLDLAAPGEAAATLAATSLPNGMRKEVFGFLPYWMLSSTDLQWMQYQLVTSIAYFGVAARSDGTLAVKNSDGTLTAGWAGWTSSGMTTVTNAAHARGVRVVLTVTMMAWDGGVGQAALLGSATARSKLVAAVVKAVGDRAADGVNLDFEPVSTSLRDQYTSFVRQLKAGLAAGGVGSYLTVDTMAGAATWSTGYDVAGLTASGAANALFVMGYDYSWSGSGRAGGVAPMESPYMLDVNESVDDYLGQAAGGKIIWGVPYYGRTWQTTSGDLNALTRSGAAGASRAYYYTGARDKAAQFGRLWDSVGRVPWFKYWDSAAGTWVEGYYDDAVSLAYKYDMVNQRGLAGTGMWTLLMDEGDSALWNLIANKFVNDTTPPTGGIRLLPSSTDALATQVSWAATDVGSGVRSYSVQVQDRSSTTWTPWLTGTTATSAYYVGVAGHNYEFRVSAVDFKGNAQPWLAAHANPGSSLAVGGFAKVAVDTLNVRSGAGTGFTVLDTLSGGSVVALLGGPIDASGYRWYQVQFGFTEWPSAAYPRVGWAAAANGTTPYMTPAPAPSVTTFSPTISDYQVAPRLISPNGDGTRDTAAVTFNLPRPATAATLDVLSAAGQVIDSLNLGARGSGLQVASWDGQTTSGAHAADGSYLLRVTASDALGVHRSPAAGVDAAVLNAWGVTVDLTPPAVTHSAPRGTVDPHNAVISATFSEPVFGVSGNSFRLVDSSTGAPVAGVVSYDSPSHVATFAPGTSLVLGHSYRASLTPSIHDRAGNRLVALGWTFTLADLSPPTLVSRWPAPNATGITMSPTVTVRFSEPITGLSTGNMILRVASSGATVAAAVAYDPATLTATLRPNAPLQPATSYKMGMSGSIKDLAGNSLAWTTWTFKTTASETYNPARVLKFAAGTYTAYQFSSSGAVLAHKTYTLGKASSAHTTKRAAIPAHSGGWYYISDGVWAGYWMREGTGITLG
jgi:spore germination protein YaaH